MIKYVTGSLVPCWVKEVIANFLKDSIANNSRCMSDASMRCGGDP